MPAAVPVAPAVPVPVAVPAVPVPVVSVPAVSVVPVSVPVPVPPSSKDLVPSSPVVVPGSVVGGPVGAGAVGMVIGVNVTRGSAASFALVYVL